MSFGDGGKIGFGEWKNPNPVAIATNIIAAALSSTGASNSLTHFNLNAQNPERPFSAPYFESSNKKGVKAPWARGGNDDELRIGSEGFSGGPHGLVKKRHRPSGSRGGRSLARRKRSAASSQPPQKMKKSEEPKSAVPYDGVHNDLFRCTVCDLSAWNGMSFERHLRGRPHHDMMELVGEQHDRMADFLRQRAKIVETQKSIALEKHHKHKGGKSPPSKVFCNMCNLDVCGPMPLHRKSPSHKNLKSFLHPRCKPCDVEFQERKDWDEHKFSKGHLLKLTQAGTIRLDEQEYSAGVLPSPVDELSKDKKDSAAAAAAAAAKTSAESGDGKAGSKAEAGLEVSDEDKKKEETMLSDENILAYEIPPPEAQQVVGVSMVKPVNGYFCCVCKKFFASNYTDHCKSQSHYLKFAENVEARKDKERKRLENDTTKQTSSAEATNEDGNAQVPGKTLVTGEESAAS